MRHLSACSCKLLIFWPLHNTTKYLSAYLKLSSAVVKEHQKATQQWLPFLTLKASVLNWANCWEILIHCVNIKGIFWVCEQFCASSIGGDADTIFRAKIIQIDKPANAREFVASTPGAHHKDGTSFYCPPCPKAWQPGFLLHLERRNYEEKKYVCITAELYDVFIDLSFH